MYENVRKLPAWKTYYKDWRNKRYDYKETRNCIYIGIPWVRQVFPLSQIMLAMC